MKTIAASESKPSLDTVLDLAQKERVLLTRAGKPSAVVIGIESYDEEDLRLVASHDFWQLIESRRQGTSIPFAELKARLGTSRPAESKKAGNGKRRTRSRVRTKNKRS